MADVKGIVTAGIIAAIEDAKAASGPTEALHIILFDTDIEVLREFVALREHAGEMARQYEKWGDRDQDDPEGPGFNLFDALHQVTDAISGIDYGEPPT